MTMLNIAILLGFVHFFNEQRLTHGLIKKGVSASSMKAPLMTLRSQYQPRK